MGSDNAKSASSIGGRRIILKKIKRFFVGIIQDVAFVFGKALICFLPRRAERAVGSLIGYVCRVLPTRYSKIAKANIELVYGDSLDAAAKRELLKKCFRHQGTLIADYFWFSSASDKRLKKHCAFGDDICKRWATEDFPGILVTAHIGNWELAGRYMSSYGRQLWSVFKPIGSSFITRRLVSFRESQGQHAIPRSGAMVGVMRALRSGGIVALVLDQHTNISAGGAYYDFFNLPASFSTAAGVLSTRLKTPIFVGGAMLDPATDKYVIHTIREFSAEEAVAMGPDKLNREIVRSLEEMIRRYPEQWFWSYPRWKRYRNQDEIPRYPFYAKFDPEGAAEPSE